MAQATARYSRVAVSSTVWGPAHSQRIKGEHQARGQPGYINHRCTPPSSQKIYSHAAKMIQWIRNIPDTIKSALTNPHLPYESGEIEQYTDDRNEQQYAVYEDPDLYELRSDNSGFAVKLPSPHDTTDWDLECPINGLSKVSLWGSGARSFRPIMGLTCATFPPDEWWTSPFHLTPFRLSELSVHRLTLMFTRLLGLSAPPNCDGSYALTSPSRSPGRIYGCQ